MSGLAELKVSIVKIDLGSKISDAIPTFVEIIGVFVAAHSNIDWGPPSYLEATMHRSKHYITHLRMKISSSQMF